MTDAVQRAQAILALALGVEVGSVDVSASSTNTEAWDSLAHMRLVMAVEQEIGRPLTPQEILSLDCIENLACLLP